MCRISLPGPVTGSGVLSDLINVANDKLLGQYFQVTLRNWNYCNPYDDPNIPGPPVNQINGDHPPVTTTAIILIVPYPDATINPVDTMCINNPAITLVSKDPGCVWSGAVSNNIFDPAVTGVGNHVVNYSITNISGCSDADQISISVMPVPVVNINPAGTFFINSLSQTLTATPAGGIFSGDGMTGSVFKPSAAGLGSHVIQYQTIPDRFGCMGTDTIHIKVIMPLLPVATFYQNPVAVFNVYPTEVTNNSQIVVFSNYSYYDEFRVWKFGDGTTSSEENPWHKYETVEQEYSLKIFLNGKRRV
jgi:hypothetical protein